MNQLWEHREQRVGYDGFVRLLHSRADERTIVAHAENLSATGIFVTSPEPIEVGTEVLCDLPLEERRLKLRGRVAWVGAIRQQAALGMGIEFVDPTDVDSEALQRVIDGSDQPDGKPTDGRAVRVWFEGMEQPIAAEALVSETGIRLRTTLPFLRLSSAVRYAFGEKPREPREGRVASVMLQASTRQPVPRLQVDVDSVPRAEPSVVFDDASLDTLIDLEIDRLTRGSRPTPFPPPIADSELDRSPDQTLADEPVAYELRQQDRPLELTQPKAGVSPSAETLPVTKPTTEPGWQPADADERPTDPGFEPRSLAEPITEHRVAEPIAEHRVAEPVAEHRVAEPVAERTIEARGGQGRAEVEPLALLDAGDPSHWSFGDDVDELIDDELLGGQRRRRAWLWIGAIAMATIAVASSVHTGLWRRVGERIDRWVGSRSLGRMWSESSEDRTGSSEATDHQQRTASAGRTAAARQRSPLGADRTAARATGHTAGIAARAAAPAAAPTQPAASSARRPREPHRRDKTASTTGRARRARHGHEATTRARAASAPVPSVTRSGARATITVPLDGTTEDERHYPLADPDGIAIKLPRARVGFALGTHRLHGPFRALWVRRYEGGVQVRVLFDEPGAKYTLELQDHSLTVSVPLRSTDR